MRRRKIRLTTNRGWFAKSVQADVYGSFAVHNSVPVEDDLGDKWRPDPSRFAVTHVPTGKSLSFALDLEHEDAVRIANSLSDTHEFDGPTLSDDCRWIAEAVVALALEET